jgi:hypothetical protein
MLGRVGPEDHLNESVNFFLIAQTIKIAEIPTFILCVYSFPLNLDGFHGLLCKAQLMRASMFV